MYAWPTNSASGFFEKFHFFLSFFPIGLIFLKISSEKLIFMPLKALTLLEFRQKSTPWARLAPEFADFGGFDS